MVHGRRPATDAEAKTLASSIRLRILRLCLDRAMTNKEIAERLDANPATTLHHVRRLVDTGFLVAQEVRRGTRGSREVPYLATGKSWELDLGTRNEFGIRALLDAFRDEVSLLRLGTDAVYTSRLGLRLTADEVEELNRRMEELLDEYRHRPPTPDGQPYSLFYALIDDVIRADRLTPPAAS